MSLADLSTILSGDYHIGRGSLTSCISLLIDISANKVISSKDPALAECLWEMNVKKTSMKTSNWSIL